MKRVAGARRRVAYLHLADGRMISMFRTDRCRTAAGSRPIEDVTEQHTPSKQRAAARAKRSAASSVEGAISAFRRSMESVLRTVNDSAAAMKQTASLAVRNRPARPRSTRKARCGTSNEASTNVATAATAADELASSIGEISRQLVQHHRCGASRGQRSATRPITRSRDLPTPRRRSATWSS